MIKKKVLFISRDRTLLKVAKGAKRADSLDRLELLPKVISSLNKLKNENNYELVMVTNQEGLGTGEFPEDKFWRVQNKLLQILENEGVVFDAIFIDRSYGNENIPTRKPKSGMLQGYSNDLYDLKNSYVIGDSVGDIELAENLGIKSIYLSENNTRDASSWDEILAILLKSKKTFTHKVENDNAKIDVKLSFPGKSKFKINSSNEFFNHLIKQISNITKCDISINILEGFFVDGHYTMEAVGEGLGYTFSELIYEFDQPLNNGFHHVEDDTKSEVILNFNRKPDLQWNISFKRTYIGNIPTEMFSKFFKSFTIAGKCSIYIKSEAENEHNMIESVFKSFSASLKMILNQFH